MLLPGRSAAKALGVSQDTLRSLGDQGLLPCVRLPNGHRRYDVSQYTNTAAAATEQAKQRRRICYCRVSRKHQHADLERQVQHMRERFPDHEVITDIASGINFKRPGLHTILRAAQLGTVERVVVAYRDRLARVAADLIEWILQEHKTELVVLNPPVDSIEGDLAEDLMAIVNVFCCRAHGRRKYAKAKSAEGDQDDAKKSEPQHGTAGATVSAAE